MKNQFEIVRLERQAKIPVKCHVCGAQLKKVFWIRHNGVIRPIGTTCLERFGGEGLVSEAKRYEKEGSSYLSPEERAHQAQMKEAMRRAQLEEHIQKYAPLIQKLIELKAHGRSEFARRFATEQGQAILQGATPTKKQFDLIQKLLDSLTDPSFALGKPGDKISAQATVVGAEEWMQQSHSGYGQERVYGWTFRTDDQAMLVWETQSMEPFPIGTTVNLKATVGRHFMRADVPYTKILRVKMTRTSGLRQAGKKKAYASPAIGWTGTLRYAPPSWGSIEYLRGERLGKQHSIERSKEAFLTKNPRYAIAQAKKTPR